MELVTSKDIETSHLGVKPFAWALNLDNFLESRNLRKTEGRVHLLQLPGFLGTVIVAAAYLPQIRHLLKEHCSAGISVSAYALWGAGSALFLIHALMIRDVVFITVQIINLSAILTIIIFVRRYEGQPCQDHVQSSRQSRGAGASRSSHD